MMMRSKAKMVDDRHTGDAQADRINATAKGPKIRIEHTHTQALPARAARRYRASVQISVLAGTRAGGVLLPFDFD